MYFVKRLILSCLLTVTGCDNMWDDLNPAGTDERPPVEAGVVGPFVGQIAADFTVSDTLYNFVTLSSELGSSDAIVLYFNMWCPVCDSHMSHMRTNVVPHYPGVKFFAVDYVSGSVDVSRAAQVSAGYAGDEFTVLVDEKQALLGLYKGTMGTAVVISSGGIIKMNEDYKDGAKLNSTLESLL